MILYFIMLSFASPAARISAPFLHHFCAMKCNSELYRTTPGQVSSKSQPIANQRGGDASEPGFENRFTVKKR